MENIENLSLDATTDSTSLPTPNNEIESRIISDEKRNHEEAIAASEKNPVRIHKNSTLWTSINKERKNIQPFFASTCTTLKYTGSNQPRFILTYEVFNCVCVFAYAPGKSPIAFGAHLDIEIMYGYLKRSGYKENNKKMMETLVSQLKSSFKDVSPKDVVITLVGGHQLDDQFVMVGKTGLYSCIRRALKRSGFTNIDESLGLKFRGQRGDDPMGFMTIPNLYKENQVFVIAGMTLLLALLLFIQICTKTYRLVLTCHPSLKAFKLCLEIVMYSLLLV